MGKNRIYPSTSYARPSSPQPMTAQDALLQAAYWIRFSNTPENALPWLVYASRMGQMKEDFDEIAYYDIEVQKRTPSKWRAYHQGRLNIRRLTYPKSLPSRDKKRAKGG